MEYIKATLAAALEYAILHRKPSELAPNHKEDWFFANPNGQVAWNWRHKEDPAFYLCKQLSGYDEQFRIAFELLDVHMQHRLQYDITNKVLARTAIKQYKERVRTRDEVQFADNLKQTRTKRIEEIDRTIKALEEERKKLEQMIK